MAKARRKIKTPEQKVTRLAKRLLPAVQASRGGFALRDVSNHSEADQRHMMRSEEKETIRRLTRIEKMQRAGTISKEEAAACEWYSEAYSLGYDTLGITANYEASGGGGGGVYTHLARYKAQQEARADYLFARAGIPAFLIGLFERVVIKGEAIGGKGRSHERLASQFRLAANVLHGRISHMLPVS